MANIGNGRPVRVCDACGVVDDHPRHSFAGTIPGQEITGPPDEEVLNRMLETAPVADRSRLVGALMDRSTIDRHLDCCREVGCPLSADDPHNCANKTAGAEELRGRKLVAHIEQKGA